MAAVLYYSGGTLVASGGSLLYSGMTPNIAALPNAASAVAPWTTFLAATNGKSWALNTAYTDNTGAVLRRLTNRSTLGVGSGSFCMEYGEGGPRISQPLGGGQYWVAFINTVSATLYIGKYQLGTGFVSTFTAAAQVTGGNLGSVFSQLPGEQNILYLANEAGQTIHRFDCSLNAYASNAVWNGTNASISCGVTGPGWMQSSWDGTRIVFQANWAGNPTKVFCLNPSTGTMLTYSGSVTSPVMIVGGSVSSATTTSITDTTRSWYTVYGGQLVNGTLTFTSGVNNGTTRTITSCGTDTLNFSALGTACSPGDTYNVSAVNELHMLKGSTNVVFLLDNNPGIEPGYAWFPASGVVTQPYGTALGVYGGHCDAGAANLYTMDPNGTYDVMEEYTPGTAPGSDGGAWTGSQTNYWGTSAATAPDTTAAHWNTSYAQPGAGALEWAMRGSDGEQYNNNTANGWSVYSGSIYETTVSFLTSGQATRGVVGVLLWNGTVGQGSQYTGNLPLASSLGAMTAGSYYWNGTTLYVWLAAGGSPSGKVIISANALQTASIALYQNNGSTIKRVCWIYSVADDGYANYYNTDMANLSPDGLFGIYNCDLGDWDGNVDLVSFELPSH
jgi:hypothetical protein